MLGFNVKLVVFYAVCFILVAGLTSQTRIDIRDTFLGEGETALVGYENGEFRLVYPYEDSLTLLFPGGEGLLKLSSSLDEEISGLGVDIANLEGRVTTLEEASSGVARVFNIVPTLVVGTENRSFDFPETATNIALYRNGLRLSPTVDYVIVDNDTIQLTAYYANTTGVMLADYTPYVP